MYGLLGWLLFCSIIFTFICLWLTPRSVYLWCVQLSWRLIILFIFLLLVAEPTFPSRICSSAPLLYFLIICPCIMFILLLISLLCLYWKTRKLSTLSLNTRREKALWVDLKGTEDRSTNRREEEEEEDDHWVLRGACHPMNELGFAVGQARMWICLWPRASFLGVRWNICWVCMQFLALWRVSLWITSSTPPVPPWTRRYHYPVLHWPHLAEVQGPHLYGEKCLPQAASWQLKALLRQSQGRLPFALLSYVTGSLETFADVQSQHWLLRNLLSPCKRWK